MLLILAALFDQGARWSYLSTRGAPGRRRLGARAQAPGARHTAGERRCPSCCCVLERPRCSGVCSLVVVPARALDGRCVRTAPRRSAAVVRAHQQRRAAPAAPRPLRGGVVHPEGRWTSSCQRKWYAVLFNMLFCECERAIRFLQEERCRVPC